METKTSVGTVGFFSGIDLQVPKPSRKIISFPDPSLETFSTLVMDDENTEESITEMFASLVSASDGVALAAPQIGIKKRIFIVDRSKFSGWNFPCNVVINPIWKITDGKTEISNEGCLSFPGLRIPVDRHLKVVVSFWNEKNIQMTGNLEGFAARVFQHESDHLNGRLMIHGLPEKKQNQILNRMKGKM